MILIKQKVARQEISKEIISPRHVPGGCQVSGLCLHQGGEEDGGEGVSELSERRKVNVIHTSHRQLTESLSP